MLKGKNIDFSYSKDKTFIKNLNIDIPKGKVTTILGPNGSGKSTLLSILSCFNKPQKGDIYLDDIKLNKLKYKEIAKHIACVHQHNSAPEDIDVETLVSYGRSPYKKNSKEDKRLIDFAIKATNLSEIRHKKVMDLSGGQRQRAFIAMSLAQNTEVLLLDEPFGALDAQVRKELRRWLRELQHELNVTSIFVTHDQDEALDMSDRIVVMNKGQVEQIDEPSQIYHAPQTPFVTQFVGDVNVFHGHIDQGNLVIGEFAHNLQTHSNATHAVNNQSATAYIRPYELTLSRESHNALASGTIRHINAIGFIVRIEVESSQTAQPIEVILTKENYLNAQYKIGDHIYLVPDKLNLFQEMNI